MTKTQNPRQQNKKPGEGSVQAYLEVAEIRDNTLIMKDGSLRSALMVSSINFDLKSSEEQEAIVGSYQNFLNSLNYPIQILVRSRKMVLDNYMYKLKEKYDNEESRIIKNQIDQYANFIDSLLDISEIMDKKFYIVVPFFPTAINTNVKKIGLIQKIGQAINPTWKQATKEEEFQANKAQLVERVGMVMDGLANVELKAAQLNTKELIELFYEVYNFETSQREKITDINKINANVIK